MENIIPSYGFQSSYGPRDVNSQIVSLQELFPNLDIGLVDEKLITNTLPLGAEGWFVVPRWEIFSSYYTEAVGIVFRKIKETRGFYQPLESLILSVIKHLVRHEHSDRMLKEIGRQQNTHNVFLIPAQFGGRFLKCFNNGFVPDDVYLEMAPNEFCLGVFEAGIMLLTHPKRISSITDKGIVCAGDICNIPGSLKKVPWIIQAGSGKNGLPSIYLLDTNNYEICSNSGFPTGFLP